LVSVAEKGMKDGDYHQEMNSVVFLEWFENPLMPALKNPGLVVLDNASYHNVKTEDSVCPNFSQKKAVLQNYLTRHNIPFSNMIILQPVSSSESSSQKSMIIGYMTLLSIQFSLQYSFAIVTTCSSAFVHTSFVFFSKAAYVSSLTSFNRKVVKNVKIE
jgi:hypothetical protein